MAIHSWGDLEADERGGETEEGEQRGEYGATSISLLMKCSTEELGGLFAGNSVRWGQYEDDGSSKIWDSMETLTSITVGKSCGLSHSLLLIMQPLNSSLPELLPRRMSVLNLCRPDRRFLGGLLMDPEADVVEEAMLLLQSVADIFI
jgi:hypothetical protein